MFNYFKSWYQRNFSNPQVVTLSIFLLTGLGVILFAGELLAPVLTILVIAYLLDGAVNTLQKGHSPRSIALLVVFMIFIAVLFGLIFLFLPLFSKQLSQFILELPVMISAGQQLLLELPQRFPTLVTEQQMIELIGMIRSQVLLLGQGLLLKPFASVVGLISILIYLVLVPLMVFFMLKDKAMILSWIEGFVPHDRELSHEVWFEVNGKIASYVRGKAIEIGIVFSVTYITFSVIGLNYALILAVLVGLSVIIPYAGAAVVTLPIIFVAYTQFGATSLFFYSLFAYAVIQFLDGNILVPLLFSELVNLHPVAIILAVLFFGGIWGVWGVFFAIPLATLISAVINAWPSASPSPV